MPLIIKPTITLYTTKKQTKKSLVSKYDSPLVARCITISEIVKCEKKHCILGLMDCSRKLVGHK